jgi:sRNA-binding regulator protein Hfq
MSSELEEYLKQYYETSVFDLAGPRPDQPTLWTLHLHEARTLTGWIKENKKYDIIFQPTDSNEEEVAKITIKFLYPAEYQARVASLVKIDPQVKAQRLSPIYQPSKRNFIKNKTLFPLMEQREVMFFTLLEGEIIRGLITGFTRYEIMVNMKGGVPITILRHAVYAFRDKRQKSYLKRDIEKQIKPSWPGGHK